MGFSVRFVKLFDRISWFLVGCAMTVAASCVLGIIVVNSLDTLGRAFASKPLVGAVEITELLLAMCIILAIPYAQRKSAHIEIDVFRQFFGRRTQRILASLSLLLASGVFTLLALQSYESAVASVATFEASAGFLRVPIWVGKIAVFAGFTIAAIQTITQLLNSVLTDTHQCPNGSETGI